MNYEELKEWKKKEMLKPLNKYEKYLPEIMFNEFSIDSLFLKLEAEQVQQEKEHQEEKEEWKKEIRKLTNNIMEFTEDWKQKEEQQEKQHQRELKNRDDFLVKIIQEKEKYSNIIMELREKIKKRIEQNIYYRGYKNNLTISKLINQEIEFLEDLLEELK